MKSLILGEVQTTSRSLQVVEFFKTALAEGRIKIGDRLPPERELAEMLNTGRSSLREAIRILSAYGIVEARQGEGTFVTDKFIENVFDFLGFTNVTDKQNFADLMKMRELFEVGSVDMIFPNLTETDLAAFEYLIDCMDKAATHEEKAEYDVAFHERLIECTHNAIFIRVYKMLLKLIYIMIDDLFHHKAVQKQASIDHRTILDAIKAGDRERMRSALGAHVNNVHGHLAKYKKINKDRPSAP